MKKLAYLFISMQIAVSPLLLGVESMPESIVVSNRILVKVNETPISVMDVVKRMTFIFHQQYPELSDSVASKYQFFMQSWWYFVQLAIDNALVINDAQEKKVTVTEGEVREKLDELFGADLITKLRKLELSFEDAKQIIKEDLIIQKMRGQWVAMKVKQKIHPQDLLNAYEEYVQKNPPYKTWNYKVISFKGSQKDLLQQEAAKALVYLKEHGFEGLSEYLSSEVSVSITEAITRNEKEISSKHRQMIENLNPLGFSSPSMAALSQGDYSSKIFYLEDVEETKTASFSEMERSLEAFLREKHYAQEWKDYITRLKERYGITKSYLEQSFSKEFIPFLLR